MTTLRKTIVLGIMVQTETDGKLVFEQETFRHDRFNPAGAKQPRQGGHQMREQRQ